MTDYQELIEKTIVDQALIFPSAHAKRYDETRKPRTLEELLQAAVTTVPFYRDRVGEDAPTLSAFPLISKNTLRDNFVDLASDQIDPTRARIGFTSGSTGVPVQVIHDFDHFALEAALAVERAVTLGLPARRRILVPMKSMSLPWMEYPSPWLWHSTIAEFGAPDGQLRPQYAGSAVAFEPHVVYGHPSDCLNFARALRAVGSSITPTVVSTFGELITDSSRAELSSLLSGARVIDAYAMYEFGTIAEQCVAGTYHIIEGKTVVEVLQDGELVKPGEVGDLVITGLSNLSQPLIRYITGDRGAVKEVHCSCGTHSPALVELVGRSLPNFVVGDRVIRIDSLSRAMKRLPVRRFQLAVLPDETLELRYDAAQPLSDTTVSEIRQALTPEGAPAISVALVTADGAWSHADSAKHRDFIDLRDATATQDK